MGVCRWLAECWGCEKMIFTNLHLFTCLLVTFTSLLGRCGAKACMQQSHVAQLKAVCMPSVFTLFEQQLNGVEIGQCAAQLY